MLKYDYFFLFFFFNVFFYFANGVPFEGTYNHLEGPSGCYRLGVQRQTLRR